MAYSITATGSSSVYANTASGTLTPLTGLTAFSLWLPFRVNVHPATDDKVVLFQSGIVAMKKSDGGANEYAITIDQDGGSSEDVVLRFNVPNDGVWRRIVLTYDASATDGERWKVYVAGVKSATNDTAGSPISAGRIRVGITNTAATLKYYGIAAWDVALTPAQVADLESSNPGDVAASDLVYYYIFSKQTSGNPSASDTNFVAEVGSFGALSSILASPASADEWDDDFPPFAVTIPDTGDFLIRRAAGSDLSAAEIAARDPRLFFSLPIKTAFGPDLTGLDVRDTSNGGVDAWVGTVVRNEGRLGIGSVVKTIGGVSPEDTKPALSASFGDLAAGTNLEDPDFAFVLSNMRVHAPADASDDVLVVCYGTLREYDNGARAVANDGSPTRPNAIDDERDNVFNWANDRIGVMWRSFDPAGFASYDHATSTGWQWAATDPSASSDRDRNSAVHASWVGTLDAVVWNDRSKVRTGLVTYYSKGNNSDAGDLIFPVMQFDLVSGSWQSDGLNDTPLRVVTRKNSAEHAHNLFIMPQDDGTAVLGGFIGDSAGFARIIACRTTVNAEAVLKAGGAGVTRAAVSSGVNFFRTFTPAENDGDSDFAGGGGWSAVEVVSGSAVAGSDPSADDGNPEINEGLGFQSGFQPVGVCTRRGYVLLGSDENSEILRMTIVDPADVSSWVFVAENPQELTPLGGAAICFNMDAEPTDPDSPVTSELRLSETRRLNAGYDFPDAQRVMYRPRGSSRWGVLYKIEVLDETPLIWRDSSGREGVVVQDGATTHAFLRYERAYSARPAPLGEALTNRLSGSPAISDLGSPVDMRVDILSDADVAELGLPPCPIPGSALLRVRAASDSVDTFKQNRVTLQWSALASAWLGGYIAVACISLDPKNRVSAAGINAQRVGGTNTGVTDGLALGYTADAGDPTILYLADAERWSVDSTVAPASSWDEGNGTPGFRVRFRQADNGVYDAIFAFALNEGGPSMRLPAPAATIARTAWSHDVSGGIDSASVYVAAAHLTLGDILGSRDVSDAAGDRTILAFSGDGSALEIVLNNRNGATFDIGGDYSIDSPFDPGSLWFTPGQSLTFVLVRRGSAMTLYVSVDGRGLQEVGAWASGPLDLETIKSGADAGTQSPIGMVWSVAQVGNDIENVAGAEAWLRGVPVSSLEINAAGVGVGKARIYSGGFDRLGERRL